MLNKGFNACYCGNIWLNPSGLNTSLWSRISQFTLRKAPKIKFWKIVLAPPSQTRAADPTYDFQNLFSSLSSVYRPKLSHIFATFVADGRDFPHFYQVQQIPLD